VPGSFQVTAQPGSDLHRAIEQFDRYGRPFRTPKGAAAFDLDLPGGLGGSYTVGEISILDDAPDQVAYELRLALVGEAGGVLVEPLARMQPVTGGPSGRGYRAFGKEEHGVFSIEFLMDGDTGYTQINLALCELDD
jgi:hypothetical protein